MDWQWHPRAGRPPASENFTLAVHWQCTSSAPALPVAHWHCQWHLASGITVLPLKEIIIVAVPEALSLAVTVTVIAGGTGTHLLESMLDGVEFDECTPTPADTRHPAQHGHLLREVAPRSRRFLDVHLRSRYSALRRYVYWVLPRIGGTLKL